MPDARALFAYWRRHPPTHEILAAVYGVVPPPEREDADDPSGLADLFARYPDGRVTAAG